ncbi:hypothetical protein [uncultured Ornithinimicrobium sp.]|uniref:hypothetical protein n=1 Tax=uncultured Ornithinimicrobium sp. TaxID=259307 RepID=UPI00259997F4|nr:hypothetical protein [uncultured Ornithinimicrobium sp.]
MSGRGWSLVVAAAIGLALVSLITNITTMSQLSGEADTLLAARFTVSKLVNAGTVWAGLAILSGWLVRRPAQAVAAGTVACLVALVVHYGVGRIFGMFDPGVWADNSYSFIAAVILGGPLGLVGAIAHGSGLWGLAARLVVPAAAVCEPFLIGMFTSPPIMPWPGRVSSVISGMILLLAGTVGGIAIIARYRRATATVRDRHPPGP